MAFTPNLRNVGSLLFATEVFGEHDSRVTAAAGTARSVCAPLNETEALEREALAVGTVRLMKAAGRLIRSRSSTRKLEWVGKADGSVCWSGRAAAGR